MYQIQIENVSTEEGGVTTDFLWYSRIPNIGDCLTTNYGELKVKSVTLLGWSSGELLSRSGDEVTAVCQVIPQSS